MPCVLICSVLMVCVCKASDLEDAHAQGVQFHPESVITYQGKTIVQNFISALDGL